MISSFFCKHFFIHKMIFKNYSILRIMQIIEIKKLNLNGSILDVGSKSSKNNITNFLKNRREIIYADKYSTNPNDIKIDLEKITDFPAAKYNNVILFNVMEHIFNFKNCIKNCYNLLEYNGDFYGSTPFFFRIHGSPNDYFRYTEQSIIKILKEAGFLNVEIKILEGGIFIVLFCSLSTYTNKIPFLNNILFLISISLDFIASLFSKNMRAIFPLGYYFKGKK